MAQIPVASPPFGGWQTAPGYYLKLVRQFSPSLKEVISVKRPNLCYSVPSARPRWLPTLSANVIGPQLDVPHGTPGELRTDIGPRESSRAVMR